MAVGQAHSLIHFIRKISDPGGTAGRTDRYLLEQYVVCGSDTAFSALVQRHGRMVLNVCRRMLGHAHDAEDAFQAVFLVLARKASTIHQPEAFGSWLHGVAYRTASKRESPPHAGEHTSRGCALPAGVECTSAFLPRDMQPILDEEISHLPERYRVPLILCYLEGHTQAEVAPRLGWPRGTVATRLSRSLDRLRTRFRRRGLLLPTGLLASALAPHCASAAVPRAACGCDGPRCVVLRKRRSGSRGWRFHLRDGTRKRSTHEHAREQTADGDVDCPDAWSDRFWSGGSMGAHAR